MISKFAISFSIAKAKSGPHIKCNMIGEEMICTIICGGWQVWEWIQDSVFVERGQYDRYWGLKSSVRGSSMRLFKQQAQSA